MVQAFRSRKQTNQKTNLNQLTVVGTYELDKVVVEWERQISINELTKLIQRLPCRDYKKSELRFYVSGYLQDSDKHLPDTKFRDYRISENSLDQLIETLVENGSLEIREIDETRSAAMFAVVSAPHQDTIDCA